MNPFAPYAHSLGLHIYVGEEIHDEGKIFTEVRGSQLWLVQESTSLGNFPQTECYYVCDTDGKRMSEIRWEPAAAIDDLLNMDSFLVSLLVLSPYCHQ